MRSCHSLSAGFDDPNLVSCAGLIPVMALAERVGLHDLARTHVRVPGSAGSNADVKVAALVAGMVAGADTIDAMDLLRHGGMGRVFTAGRAPSTLGTFLRSFTFGHVRQLDAGASRVLVNLAGRAPLLAGPTGPASTLVARGRSWQALGGKLAALVSPAPHDDVVRAHLTALARLLPAVAPLSGPGRAHEADPTLRRTGATLGGAVALMTEVADHNARTFATITRTSTVYVPARALTGDAVSYTHLTLPTIYS